MASRFALALIVSVMMVPLLLLLVLTSVAFLIFPLIAFGLWFGQEIMHYYMVANAVEVSDYNYPRIKLLLDEVKSDLGLEKDIGIFVYEHGQFNAYMVKFLYRRAIYLNSEMLETGVSDDEIRWIIGRFVGYWRVYQDYGLPGLLVRISKRVFGVNFFILPFERAIVYTGDRLGLAAISGDIDAAVAAMQKMLVGRLLGYSVNPVGIVEQSRQIKGNFFVFWARIFSGFPHTITRYVDLIAFSKRYFKDQFEKFRSNNPGLADDIEDLSSEAPSHATGKALGMIALMMLVWTLPLIAIVTWVAVFASSVKSPAPALDPALEAPADALPPPAEPAGHGPN